MWGVGEALRERERGGGGGEGGREGGRKSWLIKGVSTIQQRLLHTSTTLIPLHLFSGDSHTRGARWPSHPKAEKRSSWHCRRIRPLACKPSSPKVPPRRRRWRRGGWPCSYCRKCQQCPRQRNGLEQWWPLCAAPVVNAKSKLRSLKTINSFCGQISETMKNIQIPPLFYLFLF